MVLRRLVVVLVIGLLCARTARAQSPERVDINVQPLLGYGSTEGTLLGIETAVTQPGRFSAAAAAAFRLGTPSTWVSARAQVHELWGLSDVRVWTTYAAGSEYYFGVANNAEPSEELGLAFYQYDATTVTTSLRLGAVIVHDLQARFGWDYRRTWNDTYSTSQLAQDVADGLAPPGVERSRTGRLVGGVLLDTREEWADPRRGLLASMAFRYAHPWVGSGWRGYGVGASATGWIPLPSHSTIVLRVIADLQSPDAPLEALSEIVETDRSLTGLGGVATLRGYSPRRFIGPEKAGATAEWRVLARTFIADTHRWDLQFAAFVDAGQAWKSGGPRGLAPHLGAGGGIRVILDRRHVLRADLAFSPEGIAVYLVTAQLR